MTKEITESREYMMLDGALLRLADSESINEVHESLFDFIKSKSKTLPYLSRANVSELGVLDLTSLFESTLRLAGGRESNFVRNHYKAILVQLAYQLGFLIDRLLPDSIYARSARTQMGFLSTLDVRLETKVLKSFVQNINIAGSPPGITDTTVSNQVPFWDIDEIRYILENLDDLGYKFHRYIDNY